MPQPGPTAAGEWQFDLAGWRRVTALADRMCNDDLVPAICMTAGVADDLLPIHATGRRRLDDATDRITSNAIFLVASITKPIIGLAILQLVEQGLVTLNDRVNDFVPEFGKHGKNGVSLRHLLTHTSGLPDMLPDNTELRQRHAPLSDFVAGTCDIRPEFAPGRGVQYQSMGYCLLGEVIRVVTGMSCAEYLERELFRPLGMHDTALGAPENWFTGPVPRCPRVPEIRLPLHLQDATDWGWNSDYWLRLGAPWGGLLSTVEDLSRLAQMLLNRGRCGERQIVSPATIAAATTNQLACLADLPERDRRCRPWGLGWRLNWPAHSANFGDLIGPRTFGHWGATGTVMWIDPDRRLFAVILSTQPQEPHGRELARLSNAICAAAIDTSSES